MIDAEKYFKEMYFNIWQSNDLSKVDTYYASDFEETISVCDENKNPVELRMTYADIVKQAKWQMENYQDTTFEAKKIVYDGESHISVYFYSSSVEKKTGELKHRNVCGIWRLDKNLKINRVWAVVTPYYPA